MSSRRRYGTDPARRLAAHLADLNQQARMGARHRSLILPVLDSDPPAGDPTNIWGFDDGRIRWRDTHGDVHELVPLVDSGYRIQTLASTPSASTGVDFWVGTNGVLHVRHADGTILSYSPDTAHTSTTGGGNTIGAGTTGRVIVGAPAPKTYRTAWPATWGACYCPVHGVELGTELFYGRFDAAHGRRRLMVGFDGAAIAAALAGSSIRKVELHMLNTHSYLDDGVDVHFGTHNQAAQPDTFSAVRRNVWTDAWPKSGTGATWRNSVVWIGQQLAAGLAKGLVVDQQTDSLSAFGSLDWTSLQLRITYVK